MRDNEVRWELTGGAVPFAGILRRADEMACVLLPRPTRIFWTAAGARSRTTTPPRPSSTGWGCAGQGCRYDICGERYTAGQQCLPAQAAQYPVDAGSGERVARADGMENFNALRLFEKDPAVRAEIRAVFAVGDQRCRRAPCDSFPRRVFRVRTGGESGSLRTVAAQQGWGGFERLAQRVPGGVDDDLRVLFPRERTAAA